MSVYYSRFPEYNEEDNNKNARETESKILYDINDFKSPTLTKSEICYNKDEVKKLKDKYAKPKYIKKKEINIVSKAKAENVKQLPVKHRKRIKTMEVVCKEPIEVNNEEELQKVLAEIQAPIPTKSVIQNICTESYRMPSDPSFRHQRNNNYINESNNYNSYNSNISKSQKSEKKNQTQKQIQFQDQNNLSKNNESINQIYQSHMSNMSNKSKENQKSKNNQLISQNYQSHMSNMSNKSNENQKSKNNESKNGNININKNSFHNSSSVQNYSITSKKIDNNTFNNNYPNNKEQKVSNILNILIIIMIILNIIHITQKIIQAYPIILINQKAKCQAKLQKYQKMKHNNPKNPIMNFSNQKIKCQQN